MKLAWALRSADKPCGGQPWRVFPRHLSRSGCGYVDRSLQQTGVEFGGGGGIERFLASFREKHGMTLLFTDEAQERIVGLAARQGDAEGLCWRLFSNYHLGLQLLQEKTGRREFVLGEEAVTEPDRTLDGMIKERYAEQGE